MYTIVGLGNPGEEYKETRHNIGWSMLESFVMAQGLPAFTKSGKFNALISEGSVLNALVGILLPATFMNNSGNVVARYMQATSGSLQELIVVQDDIDLPFGDIKISHNRGAGGHNGVQSIIDSFVSKNFTRIRIGVAKKSLFGKLQRPKGDALAHFVLSRFTKREQKTLVETEEKVRNALLAIIEKGVLPAMDLCNKNTK